MNEILLKSGNNPSKELTNQTLNIGQFRWEHERLTDPWNVRLDSL